MANPVSITHILQPNTLAKAADVNDNFNDVVQWINTNVPHRDGTVGFTGVPTIAAQGPSQPNQVAHKAYVDSFIPRFVPAGTVVDYAGTAAPTGWALLNGQTLQGASVSFPELWAVAPTAWRSGNDLILPNMAGRVTVGAGSASGLTTRTLGASGGAETHTLTTAEMPSHNHAVSIASSGGHTTTANNRDHTHNRGNHTHTNNFNITNNTGQHQHAMGPVTRSYLERSSVYIGGLEHFRVPTIAQVGVGGGIQLAESFSIGNLNSGHNHPIGGGIVSSGGGNTGGESQNHTHQVQNHTHTVNQSNRGSNTAHNNMQPFFVMNKIIKVS